MTVKNGLAHRKVSYLHCQGGAYKSQKPPPPSLFFVYSPWQGGAYKSQKTPPPSLFFVYSPWQGGAYKTQNTPSFLSILCLQSRTRRCIQIPKDPLLYLYSLSTVPEKEVHTNPKRPPPPSLFLSKVPDKEVHTNPKRPPPPSLFFVYSPWQGGAYKSSFILSPY
jgi:hypothetical protein